MSRNIYNVEILPLAQKSIDHISSKFPETNKLVQAVKMFLGRRAKMVAEISTASFDERLRNRLPNFIRVIQTPDPSLMKDTTSMLFYFKENDSNLVVYVYYVDEVQSLVSSNG
jgi:hypothetical protein